MAITTSASTSRSSTASCGRRGGSRSHEPRDEGAEGHRDRGRAPGSYALVGPVGRCRGRLILRTHQLERLAYAALYWKHGRLSETCSEQRTGGSRRRPPKAGAPSARAIKR